MSDEYDGDSNEDHDHDFERDFSADYLDQSTQRRGCLVLILAIPTAALAGLLLI